MVAAYLVCLPLYLVTALCDYTTLDDTIILSCF